MTLKSVSRLGNQNMKNPYEQFDTFGFKYFAIHLTRAGKLETLKKILLDIFWLQSKLDNTDIASLTGDYNLLLQLRHGQEYSAHNLIREALRLSTHVLQDDKTQLRAHLQGRLSNQENSTVQTFLTHFSDLRIPWIKPINQCLISPDGDLVQTIEEDGVGPINFVATTIDGECIIAPSRSGINLWDLQTGLVKQTFTFPTVLCAVGCGEHRVAASVAESNIANIIAVIDLQTGKEVMRLRGHEDGIYSIATTSDGRICVSGDLSGELKIWDLEGFCEVFSLNTGSWIRSIFITNDDRFAVVGTGKEIKIFQLETYKEVRSLLGNTDLVLSVAINNDQTYAVTGANNKEVIFWDFRTGKELAKFKDAHFGRVTSVHFTKDGKFAITQSDDWSTIFWNLHTLQPEYRLSGHGGNIYSSCLTPNGRFMLCGYETGVITVWDLDKIMSHSPNYSEPYRSGQGSSTTNFIVFPTQNKLLSTDSDRADVRIWDLESGKMDRLVHICESSVKIKRIVFFPDGRHIGISCETVKESEKWIEVWDVEGWKQLFKIEGEQLITVMPNNTQIITTKGIYDLLSKKIVSRGDFEMLQCSGNKRYFVIRKDDLTGILDAKNNQLMLQMKMDPTTFQKFIFTPDNENLLLHIDAKKETVLHFMNIQKGKLLWSTNLPFGDIRTIQFSTDAAYLFISHYVGRQSKGAFLYRTLCLSAIDGTPTTQLAQSELPYNLICVLPNDQLLLSDASMWDKTVRVVDLVNGKELASFRPDTQVVAPAILSPDQSTVITAEVGRVGSLFFLGIENTE